MTPDIQCPHTGRSNFRSSSSVAGLPRRVGGRPAGFSLVELLVVIAIIAILVGISLPAIMGARSRASEFAIQQNLMQLDSALESFKTKYGFYPPDFTLITTADQFLPYLNRISPNHNELQVVGGNRRLDIWWNAVGQYLDPETSLAFWLSGLAKNKQYPLTYVNNSNNVVPFPAYNVVPGDVVNAADAEREVLHDFTNLYRKRTSVGDSTDPIGSYPNTSLPAVAVISQTKGRYESIVYFELGNLPSPLPAGPGTTFTTSTNVPFVTVHLPIGDVNVCPYWFTNNSGINQYFKGDRFQLISPGLDGIFSDTTETTGSVANIVGNRGERDNMGTASEGRIDNLLVQ